MKLVFEDSLAETLDAVNQVFFYGQPLLYAQREQAAGWIASRVGQKGSYRGLPAPTARDIKERAVLFTGERTDSNVGTAHILGEEACRALHLLGSRHAEVIETQHKVEQGWRDILMQNAAQPDYNGTYCCAKCTVALMRNLSAGGIEDGEGLLVAAVSALRRARDGTNARWQRFPFYYTLLALSDINLPVAVEELRYAAPSMERSLRHLAADNPFTPRRRALLERALAAVS